MRRRAELEASAVAAAAWIERGQGDDGRYVYEYDRTPTGSSPATTSCATPASRCRCTNSPGRAIRRCVDTADAALAVMLDNLVPAGDGMAFVENDTSARLGASALMAAALAQRRDATGDDRYDDELRALGRFLVGQITTGGQMLNVYDLQAAAPIPGQTVAILDRRGGVGTGPAAQPVPGRGLGCARPPRARLPGDGPRRGRGPRLPTVGRPVGRLHAGRAGAVRGSTSTTSATPEALAERFGMLVRSESQKDGWPLPFIDPRARVPGSACGSRASARSPAPPIATTASPTCDRRSTHG